MFMHLKLNFLISLKTKRKKEKKKKRKKELNKKIDACKII